MAGPKTASELGGIAVDAFGAVTSTKEAYDGIAKDGSVRSIPNSANIVNGLIDALGSKNSVLGALAGPGVLGQVFGKIGIGTDIFGDFAGAGVAIGQLNRSGNVTPLSSYLADQLLDYAGALVGGAIGGGVGAGVGGIGSIAGAKFGAQLGKAGGSAAVQKFDARFGTNYYNDFKSKVLGTLLDSHLAKNPYGNFSTGYIGPNTGYNTPRESAQFKDGPTLDQLNESLRETERANALSQLSRTNAAVASIDNTAALGRASADALDAMREAASNEGARASFSERDGQDAPSRGNGDTGPNLSSDPGRSGDRDRGSNENPASRGAPDFADPDRAARDAATIEGTKTSFAERDGEDHGRPTNFESIQPVSPMQPTNPVDVPYNFDDPVREAPQSYVSLNVVGDPFGPGSDGPSSYGPATSAGFNGVAGYGDINENNGGWSPSYGGISNPGSYGGPGVGGDNNDNNGGRGGGYGDLGGGYGGSYGGPGVGGDNNDNNGGWGGGYGDPGGGYGGGGAGAGGSDGGGSGGSEGGDSSGGNDGGNGEGGGDGGGGPVILDLTGQGIRITGRDQSNIFFDMAGDGYKHRTAWAGAGNGVLVIDANGDGQISERNEVVFTDWDLTAASDLEALRRVFDSNGDRKLDASDARWSMFKVMVSNADGTTTLKTLAELGITSIGLVADKTNVDLPDGSRIVGQTTYTRADGSTGGVADALLQYDARGYAVQQSVMHNADGSTMVSNKALHPDGALASEIAGTTSADGASVTLSIDYDGDKVVDEVQTRVTTAIAGGKAETVSKLTAAGRLLERTVTTTSTDLQWIAITRDLNGDGFTDEQETRSYPGAGGSIITVTELSRDGTVLGQLSRSVTANGLERIDGFDLDGDSDLDLRLSDSDVVDLSGARTKTILERNGDNSLKSRSVEAISADGRHQVLDQDLDGDGVDDLSQVTQVVIAGDGSLSSTTTVYNRDDSLRSTMLTTTSANGLVKSSQADLNADGTVDIKASDTTVINGDGSRTQTIETRNADNSLRNKDVILKQADGRSRTTQTDVDGDGVYDSVEVIAVDGAGASVATVSNYSDAGGLLSKLVVTTSATGLSRTVQSDLDGDGTYDTTVAEVVVHNADGSTNTSTATTNANGSLRGAVTETVSANGLTITRASDLNGDGTIDITRSDVTVLPADGSRTRTIIDSNANGSLRYKEEDVTSADRQSLTNRRDGDGDGHYERVSTSVTQANGSIVDTLNHYAANGASLAKVVTTTSGNGLSQTVQNDQNGDGVFDRTSASTTVLNADGSRTTTVDETGADGSLRGRSVTTVHHSGLQTTVQADVTGDGVFDQTKIAATVLNADGGRTTTLSTTNGNGSLRDRLATTVSANGLSTTIQSDLDGNGVIDLTVTDVTTLNVNGSQTRVVTQKNGNGSVNNRSTETTSDDGQSRSTSRDEDGDGNADVTETAATLANGDVVGTVSRWTNSGQLINKTVKTIGATGLSTTTQTDFNGDGAFDLTRSDVIVLNSDGSRTTTESLLNGNGSLRSKTIFTVNATGLSETTQRDLDGNATYETTTTDVTVLNADGGRTQTVTTTNANGSLRRKDIVTTSDDRETISITRDINGDGVTDASQTLAKQANGDIVDTRTELATNGAQIGKVVTTTSANGLSKTIHHDRNGDGVFDETVSLVTTLNGNGSRSTTESLTAANGALREKTVTTVSATGLSTTIAFDADGNGVFDTKTTDVAAVNADGSRVTTQSHLNGDDSLRSRSVVSVNATGLTTTFTQDFDGSGTTDLTTTDATVLNVDGSHTRTISQTLGNGTLRNRSVTTISDDQRTTTTSVDSDGNGSFDRVETIAVQANSDSIDTRSRYTTSGQLTDRVITTLAANGLSRIDQVDANGDGAIDVTRSETTALSADGIKTVTTIHSNGNGSLRDKVVTITSASLLSETTQIDANGDGTFETTRTSVTVLNNNGSRAQTIATTNANGSLRRKDIVTTSDDGETVAITRDLNGDGVTDRNEAILKAANGDIVETRSNVNASGSLISSFVKTTSANNLSHSFKSDLNGDGVFDRSQTRATTLAADGSTTTTFLDQAYSGANGSTVTLKSSVTATTNLNGLSTSYSYNAAGPAWSPNLFVRGATDVGAIASNGTRTDTVSTYNSTGGLLDRSVTTTSDDRLIVTSSIDLDGNGTIDKTRVKTTGLNANTSELLELKSSAGAAALKLLVTSEKDGDVILRQRDTNGDGAFDRSHGTIIDADRTKQETWSSFGASGALKDRLVVTTSANQFTRTITVDSNGDGVADLSRAVLVTANTDGSLTTTVSETNGAGNLVSRSTTIISDDELSLTETVDLNGDGVTDQTTTSTTVLNADGSEIKTVTTRHADNSVAKSQVTTTSANELTIVTQFDGDGNGVYDRVTTSTMNANETESLTIQYYSISGTSTASVTKTTSADGQSYTRQWSNGVVETKELIAGANDSYVWTRTVDGTTTTTAHAISLNGVETWTTNAGGATRTVVLDIQAKQFYLEQAERIFGTALDRQMTDYERETLLKYFVDGFLNAWQLATDVLASAEFSQKYGTLSNAQFFDRLYRNAVDRSPTLVDLNSAVAGLASGTLTRTGMLLAVADSSENIANGGEAAAEEKTPGAETYSLVRIDGGAGDDMLYGEEGNDWIAARDGNDQLYGGAGDDELHGENGDDWLTGNAGNDVLVGGGGNDILSYGGSSTGIVLRMGSRFGFAEGAGYVSAGAENGEDSFFTVESLMGSEGADDIQMDDGANLVASAGGSDIIYSHGGNDTVYAGTGNDTIDGGAGDDILYGEEGNDWIAARDGNDQLYGGAGDDELHGENGDDWLTGNAGNDVLVGGGGSDILSYGGSMTGIVLRMGSRFGFAEGAGHVSAGVENGEDTFFTIESLMGSEGADDVQMDDGDNLVVSAGGSDVIYSHGGNDTVYAGTGNDAIDAGAGNDTIYGEEGNDWIAARDGNDLLYGGAGEDELHGENGDDWLTGNAGNDVLVGGGGSDILSYGGSMTGIVLRMGSRFGFAEGAGHVSAGAENGEDTFFTIESLMGSEGADDIQMDDGDNLVASAGDNDIIYSNGGNDTVYGGTGDDAIDAGAGNDTIHGEAGNDWLAGGGGHDVFVFNAAFGHDTITDFVAGYGTDDFIDFDDAIFADLAAVLAVSTQVGADTLISYDANTTLTLKNVLVSSLHEHDFRFV